MQTIVTAKGKVDVGFYNNKVPIIGTPYYRGENGKSELDLKTNGETQLKIRGKATYTDEQYGALEITEQKDIKLHGIRSEQDGSSLSLTRNKAKDDDNIVANCFKCENANVITIDKKITAVSLSKNKRFYSETESAETHISVVQTKDGTLSFTTDTKDLAKIAQLQKEKNIPSISRNLNIVAQTDEKNKQIFHLSKPSGRGQGEITALIETYKDGQKVGNSEQIDFGIHKALGNEVIVIPKEDQSNVDKLLKALKDKKYDDLKDIDFSNNPRLRQLLLQQTKIDIDKIKDKGYIESIKQSVAKFQEFNNQRDKLRQEQGIELNEKGECISSNCNAKWKASLEKDGAIAYRLLAAKTKALQALQDDPELKNEKEKTEINTALRAVQKQRQGIDKTIEVHKQQEKAKVEQQKQQFEAGLAEQDAREQEYYRQEAIAKGIDPKDTGSQSDNRHSQFLGKEKKEAIIELKDIEKKIQIEEEKIKQLSKSAIVADASGECEGTKSPSCFRNARERLELKYQQIRTQSQAEIKRLEKQKEIANSYIQEADGQGQLLASLHSADRPDFAARIALQSGNPSLARQYAQTITKSQSTDQGGFSQDQDLLDRSSSIIASSYIDEGDFAKAAIAQTEIQDPNIKKENYKAINAHYKELLQQKKDKIDEDAERKREEVLEDGFLKKLDIAGSISGGITTKAVVWTYDKSVKLSDDSYAETVQKTEVKSYAKLLEESKNLGEAISAFEEAEERGLSPEEAIKLASKINSREITFIEVPDGKGGKTTLASTKDRAQLELEGKKIIGKTQTHYSGGNTAFLQSIKDEINGQKSDTETIAAVKLEDAKRTMTLHDGKASVAKDQLKEIAREYPLTPAGKEAQYELDKLSQCQGMLCANVKGVGGVGVTGEFLEDWGHAGIGVAGAESFVPVATIFKGATTGAKALAVARGATTLTKEIAIGEKIAQTSAATGKFFNTEASVYREGIQTAKIDLQAAQETKMILGETPRTIANVQKAQNAVTDSERAYEGYQIGRLKASDSTKIYRQNILDAKAELQITQESGDVAKIAQTQQKLQNAQTSLQAQQISKSTSTSVFTREIGVTKAERSANKEVQTAIKEYNSAAKLSQTSDETAAAAQRLIESSRKAEEAAQSADISRKLETAIIDKFGKTEVKIAQDIKPLQQAGVIVKIEEVGGQKVVQYDTTALTPAEQKAIQPQIKQVQQQVAAKLKQDDLTQIVEGSDRIKLNLKQMYDSPQRAASDVIEDLKLQHTIGETTGAAPLLTETAATKTALNPVPIHPSQPSPSQVRLLETTPTEQSLEQTILQNFGGETSLESDEMFALATKTDVGLPSYSRYGDDTILALREGETIQVATLDIHRFKDINTEFGHAGGDIILEEFAQSLQNSLKMKGVEVYHKGGKTFKLICVSCNDDLSKIVSLELDAIRKTTIERSIPRISKLEGKPIHLPQERLNIYAGVSEKVQLTPGSSIQEAETIANQLNKQSLEAGKYGQLNICGKDKHCSQIVQAGEVTPELKTAGIKSIDLSIESLLKHGPPEIVNEYSFFEETIHFNNINELLETRKAALATGDLAKAREIDFQLLNNLARDQNGFIKGNDNFKTTINYLLSQTAQGTQINSRNLVVVGGDEIGYIISRNGQVTVARIDLNFFGKVNQQLGVPKADEIKALSLQIISETLEDARLGKIADNDKTIAKEIVARFNTKMQEQSIVIAAEIEGQTVKVRPSLTIGVAKSNENIAQLTAAGEKNGASILSKVADAASEEQKIAGKKKLLLLADDIKEIDPENFIKLGTIKESDIASIGKLEAKPTDQLVAEFVLTDGKASSSLDVLKNKPPKTLDELVDESITGSAQKKVEREVTEIAQHPSPKTIAQKQPTVTPSIKSEIPLTTPAKKNPLGDLIEQTEVKSTTIQDTIQQIHTTNPQLTSEKVLTEIIEGIEDIAYPEIFHGTSSTSLPGIGRTKKLVPSGQLTEADLPPYGGELGFGITGKGINNDAISTATREYADTAIDYAKKSFNQGWNPQKGKKTINELETQLAQSVERQAKGEKLFKGEIEYLNTRLNIEKRRLAQWDSLTPLEQSLIEKPFPIVISTSDIGLTFKQVQGVQGEKAVKGGIDLTQREIIYFTDEEHIQVLREYLQSTLGKEVKVYSINSLELTDKLADTHRGIGISNEYQALQQLRDPKYIAELKTELKTRVEASSLKQPTLSQQAKISSVSVPSQLQNTDQFIRTGKNTVTYQSQAYHFDPATKKWSINEGNGYFTEIDDPILLKLETARLEQNIALQNTDPFIHTNKNTVTNQEEVYHFDPTTRRWNVDEGNGYFTQISESNPVLIKLESARLEVPQPLIEESLSTFEELIKPSSTGTFSPQKYEEYVTELVNKVGDPSTLTKQKIKELVLNRAIAEVEKGRMTNIEFKNFERDFDMLYARSIHSTEEIPKFSEILAKQEPGFTNVHLFRDGSVLGSSDFTYQKLMGIKDPDVRIIYVSRDTTLQESNKMRSIITQASSESSSLGEFQQKLQIQFNSLMKNDEKFRETVESTYKYLQSEGLIADGKKLRFVDTCCTGTVNLFLEGIVRHYNPNAEVRSLLMRSDIRLANGEAPLTARLKGLKVEGLSKQSNFAIIKDDTPFMQPMISGAQLGDKDYPPSLIPNYYGIHADQPIAFMDQLTVLQQTGKKAAADFDLIQPKLIIEPTATKISENIIEYNGARYKYSDYTKDWTLEKEVDEIFTDYYTGQAKPTGKKITQLIEINDQKLIAKLETARLEVPKPTAQIIDFPTPHTQQTKTVTSPPPTSITLSNGKTYVRDTPTAPWHQKTNIAGCAVGPCPIIKPTTQEFKEIQEIIEQTQKPQLVQVIPPPPQIQNIPTPPTTTTKSTLVKDFPPKARQFLEENGFVKRVSAPPEGQSKAMSQTLADKLKGTTIAELGDQAAMFEDAQGQRWFLKAVADQTLEDKIGKRLVEDTLRRHQSAEELLRTEFGIHVPQTKALQTSDGYTYIKSPVLNEYHSLTKDDYAFELDEFITNNNIPADVAAQLRQELDFHSTFNIAFRGTDSEFAVVKFPDGWHITRVDDELFFAGMNIGERRYVLPHEYTPNKIAISDRIITGTYREDFYLPDGTFNQALFEQRFGEHIKKIEQLTQTPEGQTRLIKYLEQKGYSAPEAKLIAKQLKEVNLRKDVRTLIDADGSAIIEPTESVSKLIHPKDYQPKPIVQPKSAAKPVPEITPPPSQLKPEPPTNIPSAANDNIALPTPTTKAPKTIVATKETITQLPSSSAPSIAALEEPKLQQEIIQNIIDAARIQDQELIAQRYEKLLQQLQPKEKTLWQKLQFWKKEEPSSITIPKYYHATDEEGLIGIVETGKVQVKQGVYKGAWLSTQPEMGLGTGDYGDFAIVFGSDIEQMTGRVENQQNRIWFGASEDIPVDPKKIAYIIASDDKVEHLKTLLESKEIEIEVVSLSQATIERDLIIKARINSADRANVILENGLQIKAPTSAPLIDEFKTPTDSISKQASFNQVHTSLKDGDVITLQGQYHYIKQEQGKKYLITINKKTKEIEKKELFVTTEELKANNLQLHKQALSTEELLENGFFRTTRTNLRVNPQEVEGRFYQALANGEYTEITPIKAMNKKTAISSQSTSLPQDNLPNPFISVGTNQLAAIN